MDMMSSPQPVAQNATTCRPLRCTRRVYRIILTRPSPEADTTVDGFHFEDGQSCQIQTLPTYTETLIPSVLVD
jgi:hypothetical protein